MQSDIEHGTPSYTLKEVGIVDEVMGKEQAQKPTRVRKLSSSPTMWRFIMIIGDGVLFIALLVFILLLRPHLTLELRSSLYELKPWNLQMLWIVLALLCWQVAVKLTEAQDPGRATNRWKSPLSAVCALILTHVFWLILTYPIITNGTAYFHTLILSLLLTIPTFVIWRSILARIANLPRFAPQMVIVGVNPSGESFVQETRRSQYPIAKVLGYIGSVPDGGEQKHSLPILGDRHMLNFMVQQGTIDIIVMTTNHRVDPDLFQEAIDASYRGITLIPATIAYERMSCKIPVEHIGDQWYVELPVEIGSSLFYLCWHRVIDIAFALIGTVCLLLVLPALALLTMLDGGGPVFFKQERLGYHGKVFRIYKFRSMHIDAEHLSGAVWTSSSDTRITRTGRFLRKTHLDELPQVLNILRGEMSLIGPRPERGEFVAELEKIIPFYRYRLTVRPGLTGWAQVKYRYGNTVQDALVKLQYDLYYIKRKSFSLDVLIILKTVVEVLFCRGV